MTAVLMPITWPLLSTSGPPLLPGLSAASVWMTLSTRWPVMLRNVRPVALGAQALGHAHHDGGVGVEGVLLFAVGAVAARAVDRIGAVADEVPPELGHGLLPRDGPCCCHCKSARQGHRASAPAREEKASRQR